MDIKAVLLSHAIYLATVVSCYGNMVQHEKMLTSQLLENQAGVAGRPVFNVSDSVDVQTKFSLLKLLQYDQEDYLFTILGIFTLEWTDPSFRWDPEEYEGLTHVIIADPEQHMWTPDVVLLNAVEPSRVVNPARLVVSNLGQAIWSQQKVFTVYCDPESSSADREFHSCPLNFASWTLPRDQLALSVVQDRADSGRYSFHRSWELYKTKATEGTVRSPCCEGQHAKVTYTITLSPVIDTDATPGPDSGTITMTTHGYVMTVTLAMTSRLFNMMW